MPALYGGIAAGLRSAPTLAPAGVTVPVALFTGFGINERGVDLQWDPFTGLLVTQDMNAGRLATVNPTTGAIGTHAFATAPVFDPAGSTFGMDVSNGTGGSDVKPGDVVFTSDVSAAGIYSAVFGTAGTPNHVPGTVTGPGDDPMIQPDGDWIWVGDSGMGIFNYAPAPPHPGVFTGLDVMTMFNAAGLPFGCGTRATVCDISGESYVSWSCVPGANGIFRLDEPLTTSTLILTAGLAAPARPRCTRCRSRPCRCSAACSSPPREPGWIR